ncbi:MucR family transcriptional regulator [Sphingomonas sp. 3-13AW]|uniref:MucR family transcriptional regulator n=1 Tax=Sphingomonas sp. 3-13AW TaxID=3050450 RepID=UPI003BB8088E
MQFGDTLDMTSSIVTAFVSKNQIGMRDLPVVIRSVHETLEDLRSRRDASRASISEEDSTKIREEVPEATSAVPEQAPPKAAETTPEAQLAEASRPKAVSPNVLEDTADGTIRNGIRTIYDNHLVCLEDNRDVVFLTRHLRRLGISPDQYRAKWSLPASYPMVAPAYSAKKRDQALASGLGKSGGIRPRPDTKTPPAEPEPPQPAARRRRSGILTPKYGA